jgi:hypothetical protein
MKATLVIRERRVFDDGHIIEVVIWSVSESVPPSRHRLKYRLFYGRPGERIVGYDNERGKGDHKHVGGVETAYEFISIESLLDDFERDVTTVRGEPI